jgi:hypothetical protein
VDSVKAVVYAGVDWIRVTWDGKQRAFSGNTVMKLRIQKEEGNIFIISANINLASKTVIHGVSCLLINLE